MASSSDEVDFPPLPPPPPPPPPPSPPPPPPPPPEIDLRLQRFGHQIQESIMKYRTQYRTLTDQVRATSGIPCSSEEEEDKSESGGETESGSSSSSIAENVPCIFLGCELMAMEKSKFCFPHILFDRTQTFYKPCQFVIRSVQAGPIFCAKPITSTSTIPLCNTHTQSSVKHDTHLLKTSGLSASSESMLAPRFNAVFAIHVKLIEIQRRADRKAKDKKINSKKESKKED